VKLLAPVLAALVLAAPAFGDVGTATLAPAEDVSLPFFCDWGYDSDERCYRDDSDRLALGGEPDKIWRSALRFSLGSIPAGAVVVTAELSLWYDGVCVGPRKTSRPCGGRPFELDVHRILTARWFSEREVAIDPYGFAAYLGAFAPPQWITWDVTDLVADWHAGNVPNNGVLVQVADDQEAYDVPGPKVPSSGNADPALRPQLAVWWMTG
jgi:hypothetical protein